jgi:hypothetical protein
VDDLTKVLMADLVEVLQPESILESVNYKKHAIQITRPRDFLRVKNVKAQHEEGASHL